MPTNDRPTGCIYANMTALGGVTLLAGLAIALSEKRRSSQPALIDQESGKTAQRLSRAAGTLATAVLADSAVEHYRGEFQNKAMFTPLAAGGLSLLASLHGHSDNRDRSHWLRDAIYGAAGATGLIGTGFHIYNVAKKPGGFQLQNLFYAAPLGAPAALALSGLFGVLGERVRNRAQDRSLKFLGFPIGRVIAALSSVGLLGTTGEAGLLHFRGAFHNPFMLLPVTAPPVASLLCASAALGKSGQPRRFARWWLRFTGSLGYLGAAFHAVGVGRAMGGWRNWRQNVIDGPPIPAPPSFTGLAMAGLAALTLLEGDSDD